MPSCEINMKTKIPVNATHIDNFTLSGRKIYTCNDARKEKCRYFYREKFEILKLCGLVTNINLEEELREIKMAKELKRKSKKKSKRK